MIISSPVTVSKVIVMLQEVQDKHGDLRLFIEYDGDYVDATVKIVTAHQEQEGDYWKRKYDRWLKAHNLQDGEKYLLIET